MQKQERRMATFGFLANLPFKNPLRVDEATGHISVIDVIRGIDGNQPKHAAQAVKRLGLDYVARCPKIRINGVGKLTPVADAATMADIILVLPGKHAKVFRQQHFPQITALKALDNASNLRTSDMAKIGDMHCPLPLVEDPPELKERFLSLLDKAEAIYVDRQTTHTSRDVVAIGKMKCILPAVNDQPEIKARLLSIMDKAAEIYTDEQRSLSNVRIIKDVSATVQPAGDDSDHNQVFDISALPISHAINATRVIRRPKKLHSATVETREEAIKSAPCSLTTCHAPHVYIITQRGTNMFKIGFSERPFERLAQLQTANPVKLEMVKMYHASQQDEKYLHRIYKQHQTSSMNEWFSFKDGECFLI